MPADTQQWRWVSASAVGTSHIRSKTRKQDAYWVGNLADGGIAAVVSDGAGSAIFGGQGAWSVCRFFSRQLTAWFEARSDLPSDEDLLAWFDDIRDQLSEAGAKRGVARRQFAATLVCVVSQGGKTLAFHVGDSALVARLKGSWSALCWPENGEYASSTFFVTDDPAARVHIHRFDEPFDAFALFSDGVGDLALDYNVLSPHVRFFDPMFKPIDRQKVSGRMVELSASLDRYLKSQNVCDRTDDDKTLVLISSA